MKTIEESAEDYALAEAEAESNLVKERIYIARDGFIAGAKLYELHIATLILTIEQLTPLSSAIRHSSSFRVLKELIEHDNSVKED